MAKKATNEAPEATGKAEPMTYEVRHVMPVRRQVLTAIETGENEVELRNDTVRSVKITKATAAEQGEG
jgi:hypothetical protein